MDTEAQTAELAAIRRRLTIALIILLAIAIYSARDVLLPFVIGIMLSLTLGPVVRSLQRRGVPAPISAVMLVIFFGFCGTVGMFLVSGLVSEWVAYLPELGSKLRWRLAGILDSIEAINDVSKEVGELTDTDKGPGSPQKVVVQAPTILTTAISSFAGIGTTLSVALILAMFVLASGEMFYAKMVSSFRNFGDKRRALSIMRNIERSISRYLFSITMINAGLGVAVGVALYLLGLPYAFAWGAAAFALNYLPFLGMVVGAAAVAAVSLVTFDNLPYAMLCPAAYLMINAVEGQIVTPIIVGRRLELNTVAVFVTLIFWTWMWGIPGALLAVPFLVVLKVVSDNVEGLQTLSVFLAGREQETAAERDGASGN